MLPNALVNIWTSSEVVYTAWVDEKSAMHKKLYDLEDHLGYRAALAKGRTAKRLWRTLSVWAGLAGDKIASLPRRGQLTS